MENNVPDIKLYYSQFCGYCRKVLHYLEQQDIDIPIINVSEKSENREELIRIGGRSQVPCLVINGKALYESDDIIQWFEDNWDKGKSHDNG